MLESVSGLEIHLVKTLQRASLRAFIANPRCTKSYTNGFSLTKTDHFDAKMLADYAQTLEARGLVANMLYIPPFEAEKNGRLWSNGAASW